jgi:hypothetical protein
MPAMSRPKSEITALASPLRSVRAIRDDRPPFSRLLKTLSTARADHDSVIVQDGGDLPCASSARLTTAGGDIAAAHASIQNISGLPKDLPSALWQAEREVDPDWCPGLLFYLLMTGLASREGLSWETLSGGII